MDIPTRRLGCTTSPNTVRSWTRVEMVGCNARHTGFVVILFILLWQFSAQDLCRFVPTRTLHYCRTIRSEPLTGLPTSFAMIPWTQSSYRAILSVGNTNTSSCWLYFLPSVLLYSVQVSERDEMRNEKCEMRNVKQLSPYWWTMVIIPFQR